MFSKYKGLVLGAFLLLAGVLSGQAPLIQEGLATFVESTVNATKEDASASNQ